MKRLNKRVLIAAVLGCIALGFGVGLSSRWVSVHPKFETVQKGERGDTYFAQLSYPVVEEGVSAGARTSFNRQSESVANQILRTFSRSVSALPPLSQTEKHHLNLTYGISQKSARIFYIRWKQTQTILGKQKVVISESEIRF
ncbi:MAG: hypothetical protein AB7F28_04840 [Candidatus Margulisiibacteriota bacterium]